MSPECAMILMAKQPLAGKTKTRLCPPLTPEEAALLYEALLKDTLALAGGLEGVRLAVAFSPPESQGYFQQISPTGTLLIQVQGENIGVCLDRSMGALFDLGYRKALALNTDGPSLPREYLARAVSLLDAYDLVLGPCEDGGYYLVGMKERCPAIFEGISWSSADVLDQTLTKAKLLQMSTALCLPWYDVDNPMDVERLRTELDRLPTGQLMHTRQFFNRPT